MWHLKKYSGEESEICLNKQLLKPLTPSVGTWLLHIKGILRFDYRLKPTYRDPWQWIVIILVSFLKKKLTSFTKLILQQRIFFFFNLFIIIFGIRMDTASFVYESNLFACNFNFVLSKQAQIGRLHSATEMISIHWSILDLVDWQLNYVCCWQCRKYYYITSTMLTIQITILCVLIGFS